MTLNELNGLDREQFVAAIGWVFEHSPWVADAVWPERPFVSVEQLHAAMRAAVERADRTRQLALLRAHPDLGARAAMSDASVGEQAGAGLTSLTRDEYDRLLHLNTRYRDTFGFPFLFAVTGSTKHDIIAALERRITAGPADEFEEALRQVSAIAAFRLHRLLSHVS